MGKKFFIFLFLFCYFFGSIPDSIGCTHCLGNSFPGEENLSFDLEVPKTAKGTLKISKSTSPVQQGNASCHFCLYETAANPSGYYLPRLTLSLETRQLMFSKTVEPTFSISKPPEILL